MKTNALRTGIHVYDTDMHALYAADIYLADPYFIFRINKNSEDFDAPSKDADVILSIPEPKRFLILGSGMMTETWVVPALWCTLNNYHLASLITEERNLQS